MAAGIELRGLEKAIAQLVAVGDVKFVTDALKAGALVAKGFLAKYPPQKHLTRKQVYGQTFKTDKQRRGFFAKLRSGEIEVPYRRGQSPGSEALGRKWTIEARSALEVVVGNNVSYGPLVQSRSDQSLYHKATGWQTTDDVAEQHGDEIVRGVEQQFGKRIQSLG